MNRAVPAGTGLSNPDTGQPWDRRRGRALLHKSGSGPGRFGAPGGLVWADNRICPVMAIADCPLMATSSRCMIILAAERLHARQSTGTYATWVEWARSARSGTPSAPGVRAVAVDASVSAWRRPARDATPAVWCAGLRVVTGGSTKRRAAARGIVHRRRGSAWCGRRGVDDSTQRPCWAVGNAGSVTTVPRVRSGFPRDHEPIRTGRSRTPQRARLRQHLQSGAERAWRQGHVPGS